MPTLLNMLTNIFFYIGQENVTFTEYPKENITVLEGGSHSSSCIAISNSSRINILWYLNDKFGNESIIAISQRLLDGTMAQVGDDYRGALTHKILEWSYSSLCG